MATKVKLFENSSIETTNKEIAEFLETENANVVDVKIGISQSTYKPAYSRCFVALIYSV